MSIRVSDKLLATHPFYACWYNMIQRCHNPKAKAYTDYGKRGIRVSERWRWNFDSFYDDMFSSWQLGLEIDRKNNEGDYSRENCRWVTRAENCRNTRRTKLTAEQAAEIRKLYGSTTNKELGALFGVNASHVCRIASGEKWAH
jgi:hypothetical protein